MCHKSGCMECAEKRGCQCQRSQGPQECGSHFEKAGFYTLLNKLDEHFDTQEEALEEINKKLDYLYEEVEEIEEALEECKREHGGGQQQEERSRRR